MADYTETFTKTDGDTIEASDFETEFNSIETAIATKADVDSDTLTNLTIGSGYSGSVITAGTATALTSGTTVVWGSLPSYIKRVRVVWQDATCTTSARPMVQFGTSGGIVTSGYDSNYFKINASSVASSGSSGIGAIVGSTHTDPAFGYMQFDAIDKANNLWVYNGYCQIQTASGIDIGQWGSGYFDLGGTLTQVEFSMVSSGVDKTFSTGLVNILYEG